MLSVLSFGGELERSSYAAMSSTSSSTPLPT